MRRAYVYNNKELAGFLEKGALGYTFTYEDKYFQDKEKPPVSLTLPKLKKVYRSKVLFPFFFGLLSEGVNKEIQCRLLKIDERDHFTRLIETAGEDTIGSVTVKTA